MHGDFTRWTLTEPLNWNGILHQQGRVLLDVDTNHQTQLVTRWQDQAARSAFGRFVAAVPASDPDSFRVTDARSDANGNVQIAVLPGHLWADGLLVYLRDVEGSSSTPQWQTPTLLDHFDPVPIANLSGEKNVHYAVVLEVAREALSGYQVPHRLIEPALGGVDTTERLLTTFAFRLIRLVGEWTCDQVATKHQDDLSTRGRLTATLQPTTLTGGDCPTVAGGGYTGFEHNLFRIEVALASEATERMFKWSRFNGGLVGRGLFSASGVVQIRAAQQAIRLAGLPDEFYLEALEPSPNRGDPSVTAELAEEWRVVFGARATLNGDGDIELRETLHGAMPPSDGARFFRLWHGILPLRDFPTGTTDPTELIDGIRLAFAAAGVGEYRAGDYWTIPVRAGETGNVETLLDAAPPEGVFRVRVPLALITLTPDAKPPWRIDDCRRVFPPLTRLAGCCTLRVGDGIHSHGDVTSIQEAIDRLPGNGGEICVLPGVYFESVNLTGLRDIKIHGCGERSVIREPDLPTNGSGAPAVTINKCRRITLEHLKIVANADEGSDHAAVMADACSELALNELSLVGVTKPAIDARKCEKVAIAGCRVLMLNTPSDSAGIFVIGSDVLIERNDVRVAPKPKKPGGGRGGIQIGGRSQRVRILDNLIQGGIGNGITLGHLREIRVRGSGKDKEYTWVQQDAVDSCAPPGKHVPVPDDGNDTTIRYGSAGALHDVRIENNRILDMGFNGLGVAGFFDLDAQDEFITVDELQIRNNQIRGCLRRPLESIDSDMIDGMGYGAIALADVENLVIHDNVIEDNGAGLAEPICGVFVLHGAGVDLCRNRILNRGNAGPDDASKTGRRGGINIVLAVSPSEPVQIARGDDDDLPPRFYPRPYGVPAVRVHENIVGWPLGQALSVTALGPVSVLGNQFTSRGVVLSGESSSFLAATVCIFNLGFSNELYLQNMLFSGPTSTGLSLVSPGRKDEADAVVFEPTSGLDDLGIGKYLANGNVLFCNNQCVLDLQAAGSSLAITSVLVASLDDVGFANNQCDCALLDDFLFVNAMLFGMSVRAVGNRWKEGVINAIFSAVTIGLFHNTTNNNQATHCILADSILGNAIDQPNQILWDLWGACGDTTDLFSGIGKRQAVHKPQVIQ